VANGRDQQRWSEGGPLLAAENFQMGGYASHGDAPCPVVGPDAVSGSLGSQDQAYLDGPVHVRGKPRTIANKRQAKADKLRMKIHEYETIIAQLVKAAHVQELYKYIPQKVPLLAKILSRHFADRKDP